MWPGRSQDSLCGGHTRGGTASGKLGVPNLFLRVYAHPRESCSLLPKSSAPATSQNEAQPVPRGAVSGETLDPWTRPPSRAGECPHAARAASTTQSRSSAQQRPCSTPLLSLPCKVASPSGQTRHLGGRCGSPGAGWPAPRAPWPSETCGGPPAPPPSGFPRTVGPVSPVSLSGPTGHGARRPPRMGPGARAAPGDIGPGWACRVARSLAVPSRLPRSLSRAFSSEFSGDLAQSGRPWGGRVALAAQPY